MLYLWIKAGHIVAMVAWMAGMLYLPRLFVYHAGLPAGAPEAETFKVMEGRLLKAIMTPAMIATWFFGLWLVWEADLFRAGWLHAKLVLVLLLSGLHGYLAASVKRFAADRDRHSAYFWRVMNEVPTVALILIVILVVVKPF